MLVSGDRLFVSRHQPRDDDDDDPPTVTEYIGYVHEVQETRAVLGFHDRFVPCIFFAICSYKKLFLSNNGACSTLLAHFVLYFISCQVNESADA